MKKLAIIGASYLQKPLVEKAKEMGLYTLCFAWEEGAVCKELVDEFYPISIIEKEAILMVCQNRHIDGICTIASDVAAPTVAYIASKMGLVGNSYECALRANNKFQMREAFMQVGIDCPKYTIVQQGDSTKSLSDKLMKISLELPLIVKPTDRSGSLGVCKIDNWRDIDIAIEQAIHYSFKREAIVEEFIEGREISVEFISYKGKHYPLQITDKVTTEAPHFVELAHHQPAELSKEMFDKVYNITETALTSLEITNGASHSEYKITEEGRIVIMEVGARMGGDFIGSDLVRLSTGFDFVQGVIDVALGDFDPLTLTQVHNFTPKCSGVYFLCEDTKKWLPILQNANQYIEVVRSEITDTTLKKVSCSGDRSGYMIYQSNKKLNL